MPPKLAVVNDLDKALETCAYCPKLCRAKCPVSNVLPRESLTPWGKMSLSLMARRGAIPADLEHVHAAWGCTGCHACTQMCEHDNPVADSLESARMMVREQDRAPEAVERVILRHARRSEVVRERVARARRDFGLPEQASDALVVGCGYWLYEPVLTRRLVASVKHLVGPMRLVSECCGEVLKAAGDQLGSSLQAERMQTALDGVDRVIVYDAGCAMALRGPRLKTVVEVASESSKLGEASESVRELGPLRYHDPCRLGRGLGQYDAPRRLIERISGEKVAEFRHKRKDAVCAGGGALLPASYPAVAHTLAAERVQEHRALGGGTIVSACAASLRQFRRAGARVVDIAWLLSQGTPAG